MATIIPLQDQSWRTLNGDRINETISEAVENAILLEKSKGNAITICIGTDSQVRADAIEFATVIVFVREKSGGFMYICKSKEFRKMELKERMIAEVAKSVEISYALSDIINKYQIALEVHADINSDPTFKSNVAFKEAMGYIVGMGYIFRSKPDAFASSCCADKVVG